MSIGRAITKAKSGSKNPFALRYFRTDANGKRRWVMENVYNLKPWDSGFMDLRLGDEIPRDSILAPPLDPTGIACIGLNYKGHADECGADWTKFLAPTIFGRSLMSVNSPNGHVVIPKPYQFGDTVFGDDVVQFDYEVELAVVIGKPCYNVSVGRALEYVFGYTIANDLSERVRQLKNGSSGPQWHAGKCMPRSFPIGPYIMTADEVGDPQDLTVQLTVNGQPRQNDSTSGMIYSVAQCISALSQTDVLPAGFVISTGTPKGVVVKSKPEQIVYPWLQPGDVMELWIGNQSRRVDFGRQKQLCVAMDDGWQKFFESGEPIFARAPEFHS